MVSRASMVRRVLRAVVVALVVAAPSAADASPILSTSQSTFATAQDVTGFFSLDALANVEDSTTIPHVEISQNSNPQSSYNFYRFTTETAGIVHLDIDDRSAGTFFDAEIGIWNSAGNLIANNDDNGSDSGDSSLLNSAIFGLNLPAGEYIVGVSAFNSSFQTGSPYITGATIPQGGGYTLNISASVADTPVPEPFTLGLTGMGLLAMGARAYRRSRKP